ncbi:MAG: VWA domain-containing protein [Gammaproteobacteria bacterium]|nr:VWA domain-containing protein [Gammaproteobacteria bacterium]
MKQLILTLISSLLITIAGHAAAEKKTIDAVVIIDSSGSMKQSDPKSMRKPAAKLFISLLGENDRVSIMSFSDNGYPITYLNTLDNDENIQRTLKATDKVSTKGIYTNIHAAVERGYKILSENKSEHDQVIILLSDGKMDIGNPAKSNELSRRLLEETIPKLNKSGIKVYSIAFTEESDRDLLTTLAERTEGFCKVATNDKDLHLAFTSIFEQSKQPDMLPLTENKFLADKSIREITIVANKASADSKIFLEDPKQTRFDATVTDKNIKWFISDTFDMITIKKPLEGEWKILFSDNNNKAYIVADMKMQSKFDFEEVNNISKLQAQAWLEKEDKIVTEAAILDSIQASIELSAPSEQTKTIPMGLAINDEKLSGVFLANNKPEERGTYFATITLKSQTFERQKTFSFTSMGIPEVKTEPVAEEMTEEKEAEPEKPAPSETNKEPQPQVPAPEADTEEDDDFIFSMLIFMAANVVIIMIGLGIYLVIKIRKSKQNDTNTDNAEE